MNRTLHRNAIATLARIFVALVVLPLVASFAVACNSENHGKKTGGIHIIAKTSSALASDVDILTMTATFVTGPVTPTTTTRNITLVPNGGDPHGAWEGTVDGLEEGTWSFHGDAFEDVADPDPDVLLYSTDTDEVDDPTYAITPDTTPALVIVLQEVGGEDHDFENTVPRIVTLTATTLTVAPGSPVTLEGTVRDPDIDTAGDSLTFFWDEGSCGCSSVTVGTFSGEVTPTGGVNPAVGSITWTPDLATPDGDYVLTLVALDDKGALAGVSVTIAVRASALPDEFLGATVNLYPYFDDTDGLVIFDDGSNSSSALFPLHTVDNPTISITTFVSDDDDNINALTYTWSTTCGDGSAGQFNTDGTADAIPADAFFPGSPAVPSSPDFPVFTLQSDEATDATPPSSATSCEIKLEVTDPHGAKNTGTLIVQLGQKPVGGL